MSRVLVFSASVAFSAASGWAQRAPDSLLLAALPPYLPALAPGQPPPRLTGLTLDNRLAVAPTRSAVYVTCAVDDPSSDRLLDLLRLRDWLSGTGYRLVYLNGVDDAERVRTHFEVYFPDYDFDVVLLDRYSVERAPRERRPRIIVIGADGLIQAVSPRLLREVGAFLDESLR